ncbi:response regulator [Oribacterium sp. NK2B42]|uniref:response regulator n=1 Tax=Oribacterium sp. NK2B42 TaxID=689781 RepID=UPI002FE52DFF
MNLKNYSVMLVDDEEDVINVIIHKIDWEALGFSVQGYAHNGLEALEMAEEEQPDVVMTDIKMPYMDGLELAKRLKQQYPTIKIIIFSGFDEFEYAKEAIRLEAEEYILKPIDATELSEVFKRIKSALDKEFDEKQNINMLKTYYQESLPILQENFYTSLIEGRVAEENLLRDMMDYQVSLDGPVYDVVILHNSISLAPEGINPVLITMSVRKLWEEQMEERWKAKFFSYLGNIVIIVQMERESDVTQLTDACQVLCRLSKRVSNATITAGIGKPVSGIMSLPKAYEGAREAISYRVIYGRGQAINISEIAPERNKTPDNLKAEPVDQKLYAVFKAIKMDSVDNLDMEVERYISEEMPVNPSIQDYRFFVMDMVSEIYRFIKSNHIDTTEIFERDEDPYEKVQHMDKQELTEWLRSVTHEIREILRTSRQDTTKGFVSKAIDYVRDNYSNKDLTVESMCSYLGISSAYFSTVFKKETGKTFINYLTDMRMEMAVRMLLDENEKTYVIAEAVGYSDPNYFSYAFKKKFGVSPSRYKSQQNG